MLGFTALADPTRRQIVEMLAGRELAAGEIAGRFDLSPPAISQHLRVLREARLVRVRIDGQRRMYALDPVGLGEIDDWLAHFRRYWSGRLDRLEAQLNRAVDSKPRRKRK